jgi:hypothetical protein
MPHKMAPNGNATVQTKGSVTVVKDTKTPTTVMAREAPNSDFDKLLINHLQLLDDFENRVVQWVSSENDAWQFQR